MTVKSDLKIETLFRLIQQHSTSFIIVVKSSTYNVSRDGFLSNNVRITLKQNPVCTFYNTLAENVTADISQVFAH